MFHEMIERAVSNIKYKNYTIEVSTNSYSDTCIQVTNPDSLKKSPRYIMINTFMTEAEVLQIALRACRVVDDYNQGGGHFTYKGEKIFKWLDTL